MVKITCPKCGKEMCFDYEGESGICDGMALADWWYEDDVIVVVCPHCGFKMNFTPDTEAELDKTLEKSHKTGEPQPFKIYGAYAYKVKDPDAEFPEFPPDDAEFIGMIVGEFKDCDDLPDGWVVDMIKKGANMVAIGTGADFLLCEISL